MQYQSKKKYSLCYERKFYKFIAAKPRVETEEKYLQMKKTIRLLAILFTVIFLAGLVSSCAVFDESSHAQSTKSFKHTKPLPKKWVIDNGKKPILK